MKGSSFCKIFSLFVSIFFPYVHENQGRLNINCFLFFLFPCFSFWAFLLSLPFHMYHWYCLYYSGRGTQDLLAPLSLLLPWKEELSSTVTSSTPHPYTLVPLCPFSLCSQPPSLVLVTDGWSRDVIIPRDLPLGFLSPSILPRLGEILQYCPAPCYFPLRWSIVCR